jgi:hypothetical protein
MNKRKLYTIGYTLFCGRNGIDTEKMFETLQRYNVSYLADVRSVPFSKQYPQCNANCLKSIGASFSVPYIHMPELGAKASSEQDVFSKAKDIFFDDIFPIAASKRPEKLELNRDEKIVDFNKFRNDDFFLQGIKRIENAYDTNYTLALMCSEKDPINCHRYFLVSRKIEQVLGEWIDVEHIVRTENGEITTITNKELDKLLSDAIFKKEEVKNLNLLEKDLFSGEARIVNYLGNNSQEKIQDFCDRYWNLMHGWKKISDSNDNKSEDYD